MRKDKNLQAAVKALGQYVASAADVNDHDTAQLKAVCIFCASFLERAQRGFTFDSSVGLTMDEARRELAENICRCSITIKR